MAPGGLFQASCGDRRRVSQERLKVYIEGKLQTRKWQDKTGNDRYTTEIVANEMQMLDSKSGGTANYGQDRGAGSGSQPSQGGGQQGGGQPQPPQSQDFDDDIPF